MSAFYDNNVTDVGRMLLGDIQMGASFVPTKIVIGKGYMPAGKTTRTMTDVAEVVKELQLNKAMKNPNGDAIFGAIFTNEDIQQAFYYRELGMYAKGVYFNAEGGVESETEEVLYSYGNAGDNAELIPAYGTGTVVERQLDLLVYIGNDTQVNLTIETGLYVTIPVFNDIVAELRQEIEEVRYIVDSGNLKKYQWKMTNGTLSLDEVDGSGKVNIADKETLDATKSAVDSIKTTVETINTNTDGLGDKIGITTDGQASATSGTVFAKLNKIISDIAAHVAQWTAARAAKIDSIDTNSATASTKATEAANYGNEIKTQVAVNNTPSKTGTLSQKATQIIEDVEELNTGMSDVNVKLQDIAKEATVAEINNKIGTEGDADTQPTLFGRLAQVKKVLLEKLAEVLTKISGIDGKIGTSGDTAGSTTLFGQVKDISTKFENIRQSSLTGEGKIAYQNSQTYSLSINSAQYSCVLGKFVAPVEGLYNIEYEYSSDNRTDSNYHAIFFIMSDRNSISRKIHESTSEILYNKELDFDSLYEVSIGSIKPSARFYTGVSGSSSPEVLNIEHAGNVDNYLEKVGFAQLKSTGFIKYKMSAQLKAGTRCILFGIPYRVSNGTSKFKNIKVTYQPLFD